jgi:hypothetical protein
MGRILVIVIYASSSTIPDWYMDQQQVRIYPVFLAAATMPKIDCIVIELGRTAGIQCQIRQVDAVTNA